jgi:hypothetical protein
MLDFQLNMAAAFLPFELLSPEWPLIKWHVRYMLTYRRKKTFTAAFLPSPHPAGVRCD